MSAIPLGSNDIANVYFQFRGPEESITRTLKEAEDELERAYQSKDLDALSGRVDKWSLERMSRALQEGIIIIGENVGSYEPIGVLDMDPIYIYTGYRKDKGTIVLRTYLKLEDTYTRINYGFSGYGIDSFLQSVEFKSFITGKLK